MSYQYRPSILEIIGGLRCCTPMIAGCRYNLHVHFHIHFQAHGRSMKFGICNISGMKETKSHDGGDNRRRSECEKNLISKQMDGTQFLRSIARDQYDFSNFLKGRPPLHQTFIRREGNQMPAMQDIGLTFPLSSRTYWYLLYLEVNYDESCCVHFKVRPCSTKRKLTSSFATAVNSLHSHISIYL